MASLFDFPNPVNEVAARTVAAGVVVLCVVTIATGTWWMSIPIAYGFVARVISGPRFSPLGQFATRMVAPRLARYTRLVPGPPKRFAQAMGATFSLGALAAFLAGSSTAGDVLLGLLATAATLEAAFALCLGCQVFRLAMRAGIIPESVCRECEDLWGRQTTHGRSATV